MIQTTDEIRRALQGDFDEIKYKMLASLIKEHRAGDGGKQRKLWDRYTLKDAPIKHRIPANYEKVDRRTANDFYADVVDTKVGYMGNMVSVTLNKDAYKIDGELQESAYDKDLDFMDRWKLLANSEDLNAEMVGQAAACGVGYRMMYVKDGQPDVYLKNINPWEIIYIYDQSIDEPQLVIRYYYVHGTDFGDKNQYKDYTVVEWYDKTDVTYYIDDGNMEFHLDKSRGTDGTQPHGFFEIPIIPFPNNGLLMGEPEKALDLIDAYDAIISSTTSEVEQLRLAYMFIKGAGIHLDDAYIKQLEQTGIFALDNDGDVGFVNKQLADAPVYNLLTEIRKNIYQFSKSIDMSKDFGGEMRVIGWQVSLLNLENSCKITERKFKRALRAQYKIMSDYWSTMQGVQIDPMALEFTFTRNFPRDLQSEAETLNLLLTAVSKETAFAQMSFIDDPEAEIQRMEGESDPYRSVDGDEESEVEQPEIDQAG